jgi:hypothetical protein
MAGINVLSYQKHLYCQWWLEHVLSSLEAR